MRKKRGQKPDIFRLGRSSRALLALLTALAGAGRMEAGISVSVAASPAPPAPVGTMITWTAQVSDSVSEDSGTASGFAKPAAPFA